MAKTINWSEEETLEVLYLYLITPPSRQSGKNPNVIKLAEIINRTPAAISFKLGNLASLDPEIDGTGRVGLSNSSKIDHLVWDKYLAEGDVIFEHTQIEKIIPIEADYYDAEIITEKNVLTKVRTKQQRFRLIVLDAYHNRCAISGINTPELLVAGHITPWSQSAADRLKVSNGICLSNLYDRAFEKGLISIIPDNQYRLAVSKHLKEVLEKDNYDRFFGHYANKSISLPRNGLPDLQALAKHYHERFEKG